MKSYFHHFSNIHEDKNAKSKSFNFKTDLAFLNRDILGQLIKLGREERQNARISLQTSSENVLHNMVIMQVKGTYNRPHRHVDKAEAYHLIFGEQMVIIFDKNGKIKDKCRMSMDDTLVYRFEKNLFHMSIPISDIVIFHESKIGPFDRAGDSLFPDWAPQLSDTFAIDTFIKSLVLP